MTDRPQSHLRQVGSNAEPLRIAEASTWLSRDVLLHLQGLNREHRIKLVSAQTGEPVSASPILATELLELAARMLRVRDLAVEDPQRPVFDVVNEVCDRPRRA